jgi:hypothetical protein
MSAFQIDGKTVLIDALKIEVDDFQLSNNILPGKGSIRAIYELEALTSDLLTFAKNPNEGMLLLPKRPKEPDTTNLSSEETEQVRNEYYQLMKVYDDQEKAFLMHVAYGDYIIIQNYLKRFKKTLVATRAIKGHMFYSFTKNEERPDGGMFSFLQKKNQQQQ